MPLVVENRRTQRKTLERRYADPIALDVTSQGPEPWVRFSPFYPHGSIPVPFSPGDFGASVEGIWQGLKVFENAGVDLATVQNTTMKGIKRSVRRFGNVLGHQAGLRGDTLLSYRDARRRIYLPCYHWVLENCLHEQLAELRQLAATRTVVLLDYQTNGDVEDLSKPLSHAALIKRHLEGDWPAPCAVPEQNEQSEAPSSASACIPRPKASLTLWPSRASMSMRSRSGEFGSRC